MNQNWTWIFPNSSTFYHLKNRLKKPFYSPLFPKWIRDVINPERRVIFINIDNLMEDTLKKTQEKTNVENGRKIRFGKSNSEIIEDHEKIAASLEKEMILALVKGLLQSGLQKNQLVVLAIYNLIKNKLEKKLKVFIYFLR